VSEPVLLFGIPFDFFLFALTLLGIALFHRHTLAIALAGLGVITAYKLTFTGFKDGPALVGLSLHLSHEFSLLANLFLLLMGFALLSRHFEESAIPDEMPALLPRGWKGGVYARTSRRRNRLDARVYRRCDADRRTRCERHHKHVFSRLAWSGACAWSLSVGCTVCDHPVAASRLECTAGDFQRDHLSNRTRDRSLNDAR
jgi:hypothetical protein